MAWEENSHICLHMQLIAILSRIEVIFYLLHYLLAVDNVQALAHSIDVVAHNLAVDRVDARVLIGVCGGCCNLVYASRQREVVVAFL